jgi:hypothetical protein
VVTEVKGVAEAPAVIMASLTLLVESMAQLETSMERQMVLAVLAVPVGAVTLEEITAEAVKLVLLVWVLLQFQMFHF